MTSVQVEAASGDLLSRLNARVYPVCDMTSRPGALRAVYGVPERYLVWFFKHCQDLGIRTSRVDGPLSLLEQLEEESGGDSAGAV